MEVDNIDSYESEFHEVGGFHIQEFLVYWFMIVIIIAIIVWAGPDYNINPEGVECALILFTIL